MSTIQQPGQQRFDEGVVEREVPSPRLDAVQGPGAQSIEPDLFAIRVQRCCVWAGPVGVVFYLLCFVGLAKFMPPPSPSLSAEEIASKFASNETGIRLGMVGGMFAATMFLPVFATVSEQIRRAVPRLPALATVQFSGGVLLTMLFYICSMLWTTATFRSYDPETVQMLNDLSWLMFAMVLWYWPFMMACIAIAALRDERPEPVWPRWVAYFCAWAAVSGVGGGFVVFFKDGPLAWHGLIGIYLPVAMFVIWLGVMTYYMDGHFRRAGQRIREREATPA